MPVADRSAKVDTRVGDGDGGWKREGRYEGGCEEGFVTGADEAGVLNDDED